MTTINDFIRALLLMLVFAFGGHIEEPPPPPPPLVERPAAVVEPEPEPELVPCTTDADCIAKNPHIEDDPQPELPTLMDEALGNMGYQPCVAEDGPGPCYWNAEVRGNGTGDSYIIDSLGDPIYLPAGDPQTQPDWSSGALTVCETEPGACD